MTSLEEQRAENTVTLATLPGARNWISVATFVQLQETHTWNVCCRNDHSLYGIWFLFCFFSYTSH